MLAAAGITYGVGASTAFAVHRVDVFGASLTAEADVRSAAGITDGTNLFLLATDDVRRRIEALPTVAATSVDAGLPDTVAIRITEREPILAWAVGERRLLVDRDGRIFADLPARPDDPRVADQLAALPVVHDDRPEGAALTVGSSLDGVDFDVARRLGSLHPADVGSAATALEIDVADPDGFVLTPARGAWSAIFGIYTPTLRPPTMIPGQVRLLRSLLAGRETQIGRILLASETDGTYEARPTPTASPK